MRTLRVGAALTSGALAASLLIPATLPAQQGIAYPGTLQFGTGLITIPVAWVSPTNADVWLTTSAKQITHAPDPDAMSLANRWNTNISIETHWLGRFTVGAAAYSQNPEWGFFGQVLLLRDGQYPYLPGIAVGVRNLGKFDHEDRFLVGHDIELGPNGEYEDVVSGFADGFKTSPTFYGVATKGFAIGAANASVTVGYGNGLFSDDGDLGAAYNRRGQVAQGLFFGGRVAFQTSPTTTITILGENDGWDYNAGVVLDWRGIYIGAYATEIEEGGKSPSKGPLYRVYNYTKPNVVVGYSGNIIDISRGALLRTRVTELEREQARLRSEITERERHIARLEGDLRKAQAGELADIAKRREALQQQIDQEREAIRRAEERLRQLQEGQQQTPPPPTPPQN
jgi:hypothetical protein